MVYKVNGELYAPDGKGVNIVMSGGGFYCEPNGKSLEELPADAVTLTDTEVMAQFGGVASETVPEEKPKKPRKRQ